MILGKNGSIFRQRNLNDSRDSDSEISGFQFGRLSKLLWEMLQGLVYILNRGEIVFELSKTRSSKTLASFKVICRC